MSLFCLRTLPLLLVALTGCASAPPPPNWQINSHDASERAVDAYLTGRSRIESLEFNKARTEVARTGNPATIARIELLRCATRVASLVWEDCSAFDAMEQDATPAERAYANYLAGRLADTDSALLPPQHQSALRGGVVAVQAIADPLSRLVAAGALFKTGFADPALINLAVETASARGWSRPLLAWLRVQAQRAESGGATLEHARIKRRMDLVLQLPIPQ